MRESLVKSIVECFKGGNFVEIGTHTGQFADHILNSSDDNSVLYCVDPYASYENYNDAINLTTGDATFTTAHAQLTCKYGESRVTFVRKMSEDAVGDIPDEIDFLYIDGNHSYSYVYRDLELYYPKVKSGGCIVGDDAVDVDESARDANGDVLIVWSEGCYGHYGVIKAFRDFCRNNNVVGELVGNQYIIRK